MFLQKARDNWAFHTHQRSVSLQSGANDVEVFATRGKQHGIVSKHNGRLIAPAFA